MISPRPAAQVEVALWQPSRYLAGLAGKARAGTPSLAGLVASRLHRYTSSRDPGSPFCRRPATLAITASSLRPAAESTTMSSAPSARASSCNPASSPAGSGTGSNGARWVCRCTTALSMRRSSAVMADGGPRRTRATRPPGQQVDLGQAAERPYRQPQPEQRRPAADHQLPALRIHAQLAPGVGVKLDRVVGDPEPPGLSVVQRRRAAGHLDEVVRLPGQDRRRGVTGAARLGHVPHRLGQVRLRGPDHQLKPVRRRRQRPMGPGRPDLWRRFPGPCTFPPSGPPGIDPCARRRATSGRQRHSRAGLSRDPMARPQSAGQLDATAR